MTFTDEDMMTMRENFYRRVAGYDYGSADLNEQKTAWREIIVGWISSRIHHQTRRGWMRLGLSTLHRHCEDDKKRLSDSIKWVEIYRADYSLAHTLKMVFS